MQQTEDTVTRSKERFSWRGLVIYVATAVLAITLVNRAFPLPSFNTVSAQSDSPKAKLQHRDNDAIRWASPPARFLPELAPDSTSKVVREDAPVLSLHVESSLYNRPPPVS